MVQAVSFAVLWEQLILNLETLRAKLYQTRLRGAPFHHG